MKVNQIGNEKFETKFPKVSAVVFNIYGTIDFQKFKAWVNWMCESELHVSMSPIIVSYSRAYYQIIIIFHSLSAYP